MASIDIVKVDIKDLNTLQTIAKQTFIDAFEKDNSPEHFQKYLDRAFSLEKLTTELLEPRSEFYFAKNGEHVLAYLKLNFGSAKNELQDGDAVEIERIYVSQAFQAQKIGELLLQKSIQIAKERMTAYLWLGVWSENPNAIRFYKKHGFVPFGEHIFQLGDDAQTDILMKLELKD
ncbi:GNAT family N-acetyltransferase [Cecembia rubra]|uniref:Ribosomal protein S18 acetylase RimI-like enzyme n=1 Tax=Cecembia rubra TaxID=1485585 RepID=A0A2P8E1D8_9BACT|nr:GNAT family N-acetyltransferase [Cecembia rubra]PSL03294.1 ribosomal protein S18 acetylase RimI-like enzyme [Cecembia rubra]